MTKRREPTKEELRIAREMIYAAMRGKGIPISQFPKSMIDYGMRKVYDKYNRKIQTLARRKARDVAP